MTVHDEHPFRPPPEERDPLRRLRGRLAAPVTVLTAGAGERVGITVSAVMVVEGDPGRVVYAVGTAADFLAATEETGRFVLHVLPSGERGLADRFAGLSPSPGGPFAGQAVEETAWGPRLLGIDDWAGCAVEWSHDVGFQRLAVALVESVTLSELGDPLVYFRGRYRRLDG